MLKHETGRLKSFQMACFKDIRYLNGFWVGIDLLRDISVLVTFRCAGLAE